MENTKKSIFYRHFDLSARFPVTALLGDTWISTPEPVKRLHFHNCMEIGYLYEGTGQVYIKDTSYPIKAPGIIIVPPNVPHYTQSDEDTICHWNWLYLDPPQMFSRLNPCISGEINRYQHELGGNRCVLQNKELERLLPLLKMVIRELDETAEYYQQIVIQLLESMFMLLLRNSPAAEDTHMLPKQPSGNVAQAIAYISQEYMNDVSVEKLAQMCHVSTSHFRRVFKQVIGWTPQEYLQIVRIDHACEMLYNCDYSVTEIAAMVGYASTSSLTRQFQKMYGISPNRWRVKMRSEENPQVTDYLRNRVHSHE